MNFRITPEEREQIKRLQSLYRSAKSQKEKTRHLGLLAELQWSISKKDPWYFMRVLVRTKDEHDHENPYKPFPGKMYLYHIVRTWEEEPLLLVPKSRQIMISWVMVTLYLWRAMTHQAQLIFFQSKKEDDAEKLVERAHHVWEKLPMRTRELNPVERSYCKMRFPKTDSDIEGIPQGAHQIRSRVASAIFADEIAFLDGAEASFVAAQPAIEGGGQYCAVSSAAPGFFQYLVEDVQD